MNYADIYGRMHEAKGKVFSGYSIKDHVGAIAELVAERRPDRLLDYGCGKGYQYLGLRVHERWGGLLPYCYDPGVVQLREKPEGTFGGIICTDVMEHIEEGDVPGILADIFGFAAEEAFAYFCIACRPAKRKTLPDGRNVHLTVRSPDWWGRQFDPFRRDGLALRIEYDEKAA